MGRNNSNKKKGGPSNKSPYAAAGNLLTQILEEKKSFKKLVYSKEGTLRCSKTTYAQVCHVLTYKSILDQLLEKVPSLRQDVHNSGLLHVLVYELLFGPNQAIKGGGVVKRKILQHEPKLRKALASKEISQQLQDFQVQNQHRFPRYARVNTLLTTTEKVCKDILTAKAGDSPIPFYVDPHVPDLLVFPPSLITQIKGQDNAQLSQQEETIKKMIDQGELILQDKSSCLSALCLVHGYDPHQHEKMDFIDACAAPGNKTQHLAALLGSHTRSTIIYALDRSEERLTSMAQRMQQLAPETNHQNVQVVTQVEDFLKTQPKDFKEVGGILLDPSCSGSGIYTAPDRWSDTHDKDESRIESLANFQEVALRHAMSFPSVSRIVYSTCSLHDRENELVVQKALAEGHGEEWKVVAPKCLSHWKRRGRVVEEGVSEEEAHCMIRACDKDETNGFFVCCFEKKELKTKGKATPSKAITPPKGVTIYKGQFLEDNKKSSKEEKKESQPAAVVEPKKKDGKKGGSKKEQAKKGHSKAKEPKVETESTTVDASEETAANKKEDNKHSKKIAKKLAWKKRQMEQKQERLKKKKPKTDASDEQAE